MLMKEFTELTGFEPTDEEYTVIEKNYMEDDKSKQEFCKEWKESGEEKWLIRDREIKELKNQLAEMAKELENVKDELLDWKPCSGGTNLAQRKYKKLESSAAAEILTEKKAKDMLYDFFGFSTEMITIVDMVNTFEANKHHRMRISGTYYRNAIYMSTDYNYIRFDCAGCQYEMIDGELVPYCD